MPALKHKAFQTIFSKKLIKYLVDKPVLHDMLIKIAQYLSIFEHREKS